MVFIDLNKAYYKVHREILEWALMKKELPKKILSKWFSD